MRQMFIVIGLLGLVACSQKSNNSEVKIKNSSVINGTEVKSNDLIAKSIVAVYNAKDRYLCTGTLIAPNIVLTAAHCAPEKVTQMKIVFTNDLDDTINSREPDVLQQYVLPATDFKVHPKWDANNETIENNTSDIALVKFKGEAPTGYAPATFIADDSALKIGDVMTVAGYGVDDVDFTKEINPKTFHNLDQAIESGEVICNEEVKGKPADCYKVEMTGDGILRTTEAPISFVLETEIRLNEKKAGTCSGDSGGPLFLKKDNIFYLVGVTSRGSSLCNEVGVYTKALSYKAWIADTSKILK